MNFARQRTFIKKDEGGEGSGDDELNAEDEDMMKKLRQANKKSKKLVAVEMLKMIKNTQLSPEPRERRQSVAFSSGGGNKSHRQSRRGSKMVKPSP